MGVGKSSIGKELSAVTGLELIDLDDYITETEGMDIRQIFVEKGESGFREIELCCLKKIIHSNDNCILSLGGGTPVTEEARKLLKEKCFNIYLKSTIDKITYNLTSFGENKRPLLDGKSTDEIKNTITLLTEKREKYYMEIADFVADVSEYEYTVPL